MSDLVTELQEQKGVAPWTLLKAHHARGALVLLSKELDMVKVAEAVVTDDQETVKKLIEGGQVTPFPHALAEKKPSMVCLIAQPYVLVQECEE
ncbi:MAG: DUF2288 family protein [Planctomycetes bacterium]|nr:DUF2288 family protein [Planctomycetota bacterium]